jgi:hypothetical protein
MMLPKSLRFGTGYAAVVFAIGFGLGAIRTILLAPRVGALAAVAIELPLMIGASWLVCRWLLGRADFGLAARALMGGSGLAVLLLLEFGTATLVFGQAPAAFGAAQSTPPGLLGLAGQLVFGLLPLVVRPRTGPPMRP